MEIKLCPKCKKEKQLSEFHFKKSENRYNSWCKSCVYELQKLRWKDRKRKVVELMGGKCCKCNYDKNLSVFELHHLDPSQKEYDWNKLRQLQWETIIAELKKCILVCANCHREIHSPNENMNYQGMDNNVLNHDYIRWLQPTGKCPSCKQDVYGTKYCSVECAHLGSRRAERPSQEVLLKEVEELGYCAVGRKYGVSDVAIRKWLGLK